MPELSRVCNTTRVVLSKMADDMNLNVKDFDNLFGSAIKEINCRSFWNDLSLQQKEEVQTKALEKLPEDYQYTVREFVSSAWSIAVQVMCRD